MFRCVCSGTDCELLALQRAANAVTATLAQTESDYQLAMRLHQEEQAALEQQARLADNSVAGDGSISVHDGNRGQPRSTALRPQSAGQSQTGLAAGSHRSRRNTSRTGSGRKRETSCCVM
jgi:hypothetical protein